jgi:competence protein ComEA
MQNLRRAAVLCGALLASSALCGYAFGQKKKPPAKPLDLNTATLEQFEQLPGVGPVTAKAIVDFRKKSGPFRRTADLMAVRGISEKRFRQIEPYVTVTPAKPAAPAAKPSAGGTKSPKTPPTSAPPKLPTIPPASPPKPNPPAR